MFHNLNKNSSELWWKYFTMMIKEFTTLMDTFKSEYIKCYSPKSWGGLLSLMRLHIGEWMGCRLSLGLGIETISATARLVSVWLSMFTICSKIVSEYFESKFGVVKIRFFLYFARIWFPSLLIVWCSQISQMSIFMYVKEWNCEKIANMLNLISKLRKICWNPVNLNINLNIALKSRTKDCARYEKNCGNFFVCFLFGLF